jgi:PAS domain S-box-containing protein
MMKKIGILSLVPLVVGLLAITGWWAHIATLAQMDSPQVPMVFNAAAMLFMIGVALLFTDNPSRLAKEGQMALGLLICLIAGLTLTEDFLSMNLHIDELCSRCWLPDLNPHHGRMSVNTSVSFLLTGLTLIFLRIAHIKFFAVLTEVFIFLIFLISILCLTGYFLHLEFLYSWYSYTHMTLPSAGCLFVTSLVLWHAWRINPWSHALYKDREDTKIILLCSAVLLCVSLTVSLITFAKNIEMIVPVTVIAILLGLLILFTQMMPLVRRTVVAEKELRRTNKRLHDSEERYSLAFKGSQAGVWDWTVGSEHIFSSPYLKAILGYGDHEMPDTTTFYKKIIHPDDLEKIRKLTALHLADNTPFAIEFRIKTKEGGYRNFHAVGQAVYDDEGNAVRMVGSMRDITENKKVEKLKNEFVYLVSEELKSPVTAVRDTLASLLEDSNEIFSSHTEKLLKQASQNCERLFFLMNEILDLDNIESGKTKFKFKVTDIGAIVNEAITVNKAYADKNGLHIRLTQSVKDVKVDIDQELLLQVMTNLISNAIKFSPQDGEVSLAVVKRGEYVRVSVSDQGPGIPESMQPHIFHQYVHPEAAPSREKEGIVLGLKLSKAIIEKFGGTMSFLTSPMNGTVFYFDLPQSRETYPTSSAHRMP